MAPAKRVILIVLDSVGIGAMPDAAEWGDEGSNTVGNLARARGSLALPNLGRLGLGNLVDCPGTPPTDAPEAAYGKMAIKSHGKDTMTGHWEIVGIKPEAPFRTYPDGFPADLLEAFIRESGIPGVLGNVVASGTEVLVQLGEEHLRTGMPIVYTSADSVFQVAAHEEAFGLERLYHVCEVARNLLRPPHRVGRVIARPFVGADRHSFRRTTNRHDYALEPPPMLLDFVKEAGLVVDAIGKITDIYSGKGITWAQHTRDNAEGVRLIQQRMDLRQNGLIFANLVDFDMLYGHRRDVEGYARALQEFDSALPDIEAGLQEGDVLVLTADHGNDPTHRGTDHTREYVPVLLKGSPVRPGAQVGTRVTLADLGATIAALLAVPYQGEGESFAGAILREKGENVEEEKK